jgi:hypothetical protein
VDLAVLGLQVDANGAIQGLRKFDNAIDTSGKKAENFRTNEIGRLKTALGALGAGLTIERAFRKLIDETVEAQKQQAQLQAVLRSTGGVAGVTARELNTMAAAFQRTSVFGDDAVTSAQAMLLTFTQIRGQQLFERTTQAVLDMATAMGGDLKGQAIQLGKALNDPTEGLSALSRVGVTFSESQKQVIKHLVETNKLAEAQGLILSELEREFGGSALAARNTLGGALAYLSNQWGNLFEISGDASEGIVGYINDIADTLPNLKKQFDDAFGSGLDWIKDIEIHLNIANQGLQNLSHAIRFAVTQSDEERRALDEGIRAIKELRELDRQLENRHASRGRAEDPLSERNEIASALFGGGKGRPAPFDPFEATGDKDPFKQYRDELEKNAKFAQDLDAKWADKFRDILVERAESIIRLRQETQQALGITDVGTNAVKDIERRGGFDNLVDEKALKRLNGHFGDLDKNSARLAQTFSQAAEYFLVSKLGGGGVGGSLGASVAKGAFTDLAGGFGATATGAALFGPIAAGIGALVGGLFDSGKAAKEHARAMAEAAKQYIQARADFSARANGTSGSLDEQIRKIRNEASSQRSSANELYNGKTVFTHFPEYFKKEIERINADELKYIENLKEESRIKAQQFKEDLQVRLLRAQGQNKEADALALRLQQQRELAELDKQIALGLAEEATRALLLQVQAAELLKKSVDALSTSVRNAPSGFKIESYINRFATPRQFLPPLPPVFNPERPTGGPRGSVVFQLSGPITIDAKDKTAKQAFAEWSREFIRLQSTTVGLNGSPADTLDFLSVN